MQGNQVGRTLQSVIESLIGVLIGALITWGVSKYYYEKAGKGLRTDARTLRQMANKTNHEAQELRKLTTMIVRWLEHGGENIEIVKNKKGEPIGVAITAVFHEKAVASDRVETSVRHSDDPLKSPNEK